VHEPALEFFTKSKNVALIIITIIIIIIIISTPKLKICKCRNLCGGRTNL
jgi:uncharacterized membrane protein YkgB